MEIEQKRWNARKGWIPDTDPILVKSAGLVLAFGSVSIIKDKTKLNLIREAYPKARIFGCSTAGEICGTEVQDNSLVTTAIRFDHTDVSLSCMKIRGIEESYVAGQKLARCIEKKGLRHVFVLSDGIMVNGSALVKGLTEHLPGDVMITGGLSGDGGRFAETFVLCDKPPEKNMVAALGFYGDRLDIGYGSLGGWDPFGPERLVTRSQGNILYELDGKSALDLYKQYLGKHAEGLPATGLLFPLSIRFKQGESRLVRTILSINEYDHSMIFAGNIPEGAYAQFMKANINRLIDGAVGAAKICHELMESQATELAILISCVGRKMVLKQRVEEEVEGVSEILGEGTVLTGFYSYGEISPSTVGGPSDLHNQTMTITTFSEL